MTETFYCPNAKYNPQELLFNWEDMLELFDSWEDENPDDTPPTEFRFFGKLLVDASWDLEKGEPFVYAIEVGFDFSKQHPGEA
jgi:hypothetical protein